MIKTSLEKNYTPSEEENLIYKAWEKAGCFRTIPRKGKRSYTVMMPPPNVTGSLHLGHALNSTLQDILVRFKRMNDFDVHWQAGTDHAGIATQMVVERNLAEDKITRYDLGRTAFIDKVWEWKELSGNTIVKQQRRLGISPDWTKSRFTMDEGMSFAVKKVFVDLYHAGLIYRDKRLVNWDTKLQTAVSDLEVITQQEKQKLYYLKYPVAGKPGVFISVATTRPETLFGDTAVAVHPEDERYASLIGQFVEHPFTGRKIPIIGDDYCDPQMGTGAVKITPAHDFADFEMSKRHDLPRLTVLDAHACLNENVPQEFQGLHVNEARLKVTEALTELDLLDKIEDYMGPVPYGDRSNTEIQPWLTDQWFVNSEVLAVEALKAVVEGKTNFIPERWAKTYNQWLENIEPWCISRQIWWGHQIPAWFAEDGKYFVAMTEEEAQEQAKAFYGKEVSLSQDPDVLDTWFSSALFPFSTLGWPHKTEDLEHYFPTSVLVTGFDIIFFWVARMMMMSLYFMKEIPFKDVYIHALVRDEKGQKMSKSKGNIIDPLVVMDKYGCDALRFTLASLSTPGRDIRLGESRIEGNRNFTTKIWNAARMLQMNECVFDDSFDPTQAQHPLSQWIINETADVASAVYNALEAYRFDEASQILYQFTWKTYCDLYLEFLKVSLMDSQQQAAHEELRGAAGWAFVQILKCLHPIMPFVTEKLWQVFVGLDSFIMQSDWPSFGKETIDPAYQFEKAREEYQWVASLISEIRSLRGQFNVPSAALLSLRLEKGSKVHQGYLEKNKPTLMRLSRLEGLEFYEGGSKQKGSILFLYAQSSFYLDLGDTVDLSAELVRLEREVEKVEKNKVAAQSKLENEDFMARAKPDIVEEMQERVKSSQEELVKLRMAIKSIEEAKGS